MKNLLLLVVDCARAEKTVVDLPLASAATRRSAVMPFLDSLRRRGTTWTQYVAVSSSTAPNFATMFTGLLPRDHGIVQHSRVALNDVTTLAEILHARGWHTHAEVTGPLRPECGLSRGFETYRWRGASAHLDAGLGDGLRALLRRLPSPWFLCVHLWEAHLPYHVPPAFAGGRFGATTYDRALSGLDRALGIAVEDVDPETTTIVWCGDHGERLEADYEKNRELGGDEAHALDVWKRFVARSGEPLDSARWFEHAQLELGPVAARIYAHNVLGHGFHVTEDLVRTPLVILDAERCAMGETRNDLRSQVDLFATLLDLAGLSPDEHGISDRSFLRGAEPDAVYLEANGASPLRGVRTKEWKYWRMEADGVSWKTLWNLTADPRETTDVIAWKPEEAARLDALLTTWGAQPPVRKRTRITRSQEERPEATTRSLGDL